MNKRKVGFSHIFRFLDTFSTLYNNHYFLIRKKKKKKERKNEKSYPPLPCSK